VLVRVRVSVLARWAPPQVLEAGRAAAARWRRVRRRDRSPAATAIATIPITTTAVPAATLSSAATFAAAIAAAAIAAAAIAAAAESPSAAAPGRWWRHPRRTIVTVLDVIAAALLHALDASGASNLGGVCGSDGGGGGT